MELFSLEEEAAQLPGGLFVLDIIQRIVVNRLKVELLVGYSFQPWRGFRDCIERLAR